MSDTKGIALITGSAQGIGQAIALRLASDGFDVALNDVPSKHNQLCAVADEIEKMGRRTLVVPADVTVEEEVKGMIRDVVGQLGGLDVMVANAGTCKFLSLISTDLDEWERITAVNARGAFLCYKYAAQQMIKQGRGGRIIGASSVAGKLSYPVASAYSASKFAVRGLTQSAALELGQYNITVNAYAPGLIRTPLLDTLNEVAEADAEVLNSALTRVATRPIKFEGQPEDVAALVSYLASKEARYVTGQCIIIDGGTVLS